MTFSKEITNINASSFPETRSKICCRTATQVKNVRVVNPAPVNQHPKPLKHVNLNRVQTLQMVLNTTNVFFLLIKAQQQELDSR